MEKGTQGQSKHVGKFRLKKKKPLQNRAHCSQILSFKRACNDSAFKSMGAQGCLIRDTEEIMLIEV